MTQEKLAEVMDKVTRGFEEGQRLKVAVEAMKCLLSTLDISTVTDVKLHDIAKASFRMADFMITESKKQP